MGFPPGPLFEETLIQVPFFLFLASGFQPFHPLSVISIWDIGSSFALLFHALGNEIKRAGDDISFSLGFTPACLANGFAKSPLVFWLSMLVFSQDLSRVGSRILVLLLGIICFNGHLGYFFYFFPF